MGKKKDLLFKKFRKYGLNWKTYRRKRWIKRKKSEDISSEKYVISELQDIQVTPKKFKNTKLHIIIANPTIVIYEAYLCWVKGYSFRLLNED